MFDSHAKHLFLFWFIWQKNVYCYCGHPLRYLLSKCVCLKYLHYSHSRNSLMIQIKSRMTFGRYGHLFGTMLITSPDSLFYSVYLLSCLTWRYFCMYLFFPHWSNRRRKKIPNCQCGLKFWKFSDCMCLDEWTFFVYLEVLCTCSGHCANGSYDFVAKLSRTCPARFGCWPPCELVAQSFPASAACSPPPNFSEMTRSCL